MDNQKDESRINVIDPIGKPPSLLIELQRRLGELSDDSNVVDIFKVISEWEKWAIKETRKNEQKDAFVLPKPIDRLTIFKKPFVCPFAFDHGMRNICTHPLAPPEKIQEEWLQRYVDEAVKQSSNGASGIIRSCTIKDAKKCPYLKVMPLIDFNNINLGKPS